MPRLSDKHSLLWLAQCSVIGQTPQAELEM